MAETLACGREWRNKLMPLVNRSGPTPKGESPMGARVTRSPTSKGPSESAKARDRQLRPQTDIALEKGEIRWALSASQYLWPGNFRAWR